MDVVGLFEGLTRVKTVLETVEINRVERLIRRFPRVVERLFSPDEIRYCWTQKRFPFQHFAARFAAKCAIRRALGGGSLSDICILREASGTVSVDLYGHARQLAHGRTIFMSLSHEGNLSAALIAIESSE